MKSDRIGTSIDTITMEAIANSAANLLPEGALLVVVRSGILARKIPVAITTRELASNQDIKALIPSRGLDRNFLHYFLWHSEPKLLGLVTRGATVHRLSTDALRTLPIPLPPVTEQKRIVAILDEAFKEIDRAVANAEQNLANARALAEADLNAIVRERHSDDRLVPLSDACKRITVGHVGPMAKRYVDAGITFLRSQNIKPFAVDLADVKLIDTEFHASIRKSALNAGDVAIVRTGYPGTAAVVPEDLGAANCADLVIATPKSCLLPDYLVMLLNSRYGKKIIAGNLTGTAQKHFNVTAAKKVQIYLPSVTVQERAIERFRGAASLCKQLEQQYQRKFGMLGSLKRSLLHKAFTGELTASPEASLTEAAVQAAQ